VMFMTLALVYLVIVDALGRHSAKSLL
jgi:hypothetical protein